MRLFNIKPVQAVNNCAAPAQQSDQIVNIDAIPAGKHVNSQRFQAAPDFKYDW
jgi:hypothetical protein